MKTGPHPAWLFLLVPAALAAGCNSEDADRMARVGHKVLEKAQSLAPDSDGPLSRLQAFGPGRESVTLDSRVAARLRWDKTLSDVEIQVRADGGVVELKGTVREAAQRQRAIELAESTMGVQRVTDSLEVAAP